MATLVFDIETIGDNFDTYDEITQASLTKKISREGLSEEEYERKVDEVKGSLGLSALTGQIVSLAMLHLPSGKRCVDFQAPGQNEEYVDKEGTKFRSMSEKELLTHFWECAEKCDEFVTFYGRGFDIPYIMIRSAVHQIRPSKNLLSNRYTGSQRSGAMHIDLQDQLTFYGAWKGCTLHLCCKAFGIPTPKSAGVDGSHVGEMFSKKEYKMIAEYNMADVVATTELYKVWDRYLRF